MKPAFTVLVLLLALPAQAEVYRIVNPDGSITFTDQATPGAEPHTLPPVSTYSAPKASAATLAGDRQGNDAAGPAYRAFAVASPADEQTLRDNAGNISMLVRVDPPLRVEAGHRIQFMVDGVDQGEPSTATGVTFQNVDRGSHTLSARLIDAEGQTLMTAPAVTVFLHRATVNAPARP